VLGGPKHNNEYNNLMDRVERLAFNALPAALTADMWSHVYVQQANSVFAGRTKPNASTSIASATNTTHSSAQPSCNLGHGENPSYECQTTNYYGVSHFPCCITNFPQGWPKFAMGAFVIEPAGSQDVAAVGGATADAVVVASLVPATATLPISVGGVRCTFSDRNLHSRMPLVPTPARFKRAGV
jgi:hypothetical protein